MWVNTVRCVPGRVCRGWAGGWQRSEGISSPKCHSSLARTLNRVVVSGRVEAWAARQAKGSNGTPSHPICTAHPTPRPHPAVYPRLHRLTSHYPRREFRATAKAVEATTQGVGVARVWVAVQELRSKPGAADQLDVLVSTLPKVCGECWKGLGAVYWARALPLALGRAGGSILGPCTAFGPV